METKVIVHEFKVGGHWKYVMQMPNGGESITEGIYSEIIEHKKIVSSADFKPMTVGVELHVHFEESGAQTKFTFKVIHETEAYCKQQEQMGFYNGWAQHLKDWMNLLPAISAVCPIPPIVYYSFSYLHIKPYLS